eukprot:Awhi_evm1s140
MPSPFQQEQEKINIKQETMNNTIFNGGTSLMKKSVSMPAGLGDMEFQNGGMMLSNLPISNENMETDDNNATQIPLGNIFSVGSDEFDEEKFSPAFAPLSADFSGQFLPTESTSASSFGIQEKPQFLQIGPQFKTASNTNSSSFGITKETIQKRSLSHQNLSQLGQQIQEQERQQQQQQQMFFQQLQQQQFLQQQYQNQLQQEQIKQQILQLQQQQQQIGGQQQDDTQDNPQLLNQQLNNVGSAIEDYL